MKTEPKFNQGYLERKLAYEEGVAIGKWSLVDELMTEAVDNDYWIPDWVLNICSKYVREENERRIKEVY